MAPSLITEWPPEALMPTLKLAALFGLAQIQGLVTHFFFAGPTWLGEVMAGFILGPATLDIVPMTAELQTVGQLALMVVLFERGLHTNLASIAQCGLLGMIMAILGITLSMILSVVALRTNGHPFIESTCAACAVSTTIVGLVDIGWTRRQVSIMNSCSSLTSKVLDAATTMNALLILLVLTVERSFDPSRMWHHPPSEWWVCVQPLLFAMAFILVSIIFRANLNFFCLKTVIGVFFPPKKAPEHELYNALEFFQVTFMTAFALAFGVLASLVKVPTIVGIFLAGLCFGGSEQCRESWIRNTRNLTHWLSRIFFTCSIGFLMPKTMWSRSAVLNGWELASAAFFGSFIGGALGSLPVLMKEKSTLSNVVLCGSSMAYSGEMGFIFLLEFYNGGYLSEAAINSVLWSLLLSSLICPALCQVCIFLQRNVEPAESTGRMSIGAKYKIPEDSDDGYGGKLSARSEGEASPNGVPSLDSKASTLRMKYGGAYGTDNEQEVPLVYNGGQTTSSRNMLPVPQEPSPSQAPKAGAQGSAFYGNSGSLVTPNQIIQPGTQMSTIRTLPPTITPSLPPTLEGVSVGFGNGDASAQAHNLFAGAPSNQAAASAVPINTQMRRSVPSIWQDDD